jgi:hypothetical protein
MVPGAGVGAQEPFIGEEDDDTSGMEMVLDGPDGWELSADRFEETEDRMAVYEAAVELVDRLRGLVVAKLGGGPRLEMGPVMELMPDGSRRPRVFARAEIATARVPTPWALSPTPMARYRSLLISPRGSP